MSGSIGNINVGISAEAQQFQSELLSAAKSMTAFNANVAAGAAAVVTSIGAIGSAVALTAVNEFKNLTLASLDSIDKLNDMSQRIGVTVTELQQLGFAAEQAGGDAEGMKSALDKMTKSIGEANSGAAETQKAFNALGLSAQDMAGNNATQNFKLIADAITRLPNPSMQAAAAMNIFGKSYADIMGTLQTGSAGIEAAGERFKFLRGEMSQFDASQIGKANDMLNELKQVLGGIGDVGAKELSTYIIAISNSMIDAGFNAKTFGKALEESLEIGMRSIAEFLDGLVLAYKGIQAMSGNVKPLFDALSGNSDNHRFADYFGKVIEDVRRLRAEFEKPVKLGFFDPIFSKISGDTFEAMSKKDTGNYDTQAMKDQQWLLDAQNKLFNSTENRGFLTNFTKDAKELLKPSWIHSAFSKLMEETQTAAREFADNVKESLKTPVERFQEFGNRIKEALESGSITGDQARKALENEAFKLDSSSGSVSSRVIDRNIGLEALRINEGQNREQRVSDPALLEKMNELLSAVRGQTTAATAGI